MKELDEGVVRSELFINLWDEASNLCCSHPRERRGCGVLDPSVLP